MIGNAVRKLLAIAYLASLVVVAGMSVLGLFVFPNSPPLAFMIWLGAFIVYWAVRLAGGFLVWLARPPVEIADLERRFR